MKKIILLTIVGIFLLGSSVLIFFLQLFSLLKTLYPWLVDIGEVVLLLCGAFTLLRAKKIHEEMLAKEIHPQGGPSTGTTLSLIEKQHQLSSEWEETSTKRDRLKMLKMAGAAEENSMS